MATIAPVTPKRALILGLNYAPEPVGIGPYTTGLAEHLASSGIATRVIAANPYYPAWRKQPGFSGWRRTREADVDLLRCPIYVPAAPNGWRRILHHLSFAVTAFVPMLRAAAKRPDFVLVIAPSLLSVPIGWLAARLARVPLWIHVQDFEVEAAFATGLIDQRGMAARLAREIENRLLKAADLVSTISLRMADRLREKGVEPDRIAELRNWSSGAFANGDPAGAAYRAEWNLGDRKVALYSGNIANKQGIEIIVETARQLVHRRDLVFVICGEGPNRANLERLAAGLDNVQVHDLQPIERVGDLLALASLHLLPQIAGAADLVLPSKLANMLASGRPVIATTAESSGLAAEVGDCGVAIPPGDPAAMAAAITRLVDDDDARARLGAAARVRALTHWSRDALLAEFVKAAERLVHPEQEA